MVFFSVNCDLCMYKVNVYRINLGNNRLKRPFFNRVIEL